VIKKIINTKIVIRVNCLPKAKLTLFFMVKKLPKKTKIKSENTKNNKSDIDNNFKQFKDIALKQSLP
jgi:Holliday junction resolvase RusA-like endonuclease